VIETCKGQKQQRVFVQCHLVIPALTLAARHSKNDIQSFPEQRKRHQPHVFYFPNSVT